MQFGWADPQIFKTVKQAVDTRQVAEHLGLAIDEKGMTCCPFHEGNVPNMRISDRYYCFDCRASGDVIDFVTAYLSVDKLEAAKLIANDFDIPIEEQPLSKPSSLTTKDKVMTTSSTGGLGMPLKGAGYLHRPRRCRKHNTGSLTMRLL